MRGRTLVVSTLASLAISAPAAFALIDDAPGEGDEMDETTDTTVMWEIDEDAPIPYAFDAEKGILILDLVGAKEGDETSDGDEPRMCLPTKDAGVDEAGTAEGDTAEESDVGSELPEGCLEIDVTGPNGQINHGSVVSNTVHALKEIRDELDGPLGHYIREIAKSDLGKDRDDVVTSGEATDGDEPDGGKPEKADKETGRPDHAGDGNGGDGNGNAPAHSNAGGNGKGKNK